MISFTWRSTMTVEEIAQEFENWRSSRTIAKEPIPARLWVKAIKVSEQTSPTEVAKACKVAVSKIKRKMGVKLPKSQKMKFNKVPALPASVPYIELITPSGIQVKIY